MMPRKVTVRVDEYSLATTVTLRLYPNGSLALALADATSAVGDVEVRTPTLSPP